MKINFTKKQYKHLLDLVYLGEWTANSAKDYDERDSEYDAFFQYICSFAKDFGVQDLVPFDKEMDAHFPTQEYEQRLQPIIDENDNEVFWQELSSRLAKRDLAKEGKTYATQDEAMMKYFEVEGEYEKEFEENGLSNLELRKHD
ncbi:hypothetical protein M3197_02415 [Sporosarcina aquimarina]|uniref:hypothetical protein n=1 Tax=Sporosarcina aquimarina TaxID=114975 RepID=UPI00203A62DB|nr:hypothetical protein [Sporosarcina aquimarina]MCM3756332.1 hypothetical protein [Sporosarcina aquimarina]